MIARERKRKRAFGKLPVLVEREVELDHLDPAHDGLRIAHLTDLHCGMMTPSRHILHAIDLVHRADPDLIVLTGDYVSWRIEEVAIMERLLGELRGRHVLATLGNHDYYANGDAVAKALRRCGHTVLKNEHRVFDWNGVPLSIIGIDDPVTRKDDLNAAFAGVPESGTRVVLCHCPESVVKLAERRSALVLSGHTHGGQINVRGITNRFFSRAGRRFYRSGFYEVGATRLFLNPGIGFSGVPVRAGHGTQAEVALLKLRVRPTK